MKFKNILLMLAATAFSQFSYAQFNQDAYTFSGSTQGSTSRIKAIGNASTAVGGDLSSISGNPAGLGFFNKSEFSITPEFNSSKTSSSYFGQNRTDTKDQLNLNNASILFHSAKRVPVGAETSQGFLNFNFGISFGRTNNFYDNLYLAGQNPNNSIADFLAENANAVGGSVADLNNAYNPLGWWGYEHYLIDSVGNNSYGNIYAPNTYLNSDQTLSRSRTGGQNEFNIAVGTNYSNKLYLGLTLGLTSLRYNSYSTFTEVGNTEPDADEYTTFYDFNQETTGSGFNFKLGMIYKPVEAVRLGASFTSPTWYDIEDNSTLALETSYLGGDRFPGKPEPFNSNYTLRTPMKVNGGIAVFFQQLGFLSADIEYVDYAGMKLGNYSTSSDDNMRISDLYKSVVNAKVGGEGRLNENFYLRAGYNYLSNPEKGISGATNIISGGLGYRYSNFYLDATYANASRKQTFYPYELSSASPQANLKNTSDNVYLTFGVRF
ncbi:OmpP1/FadL family transporter [Arcticibacter eurypsychrophilus]|uniref:OmpP1/FadL family transporter n=1 Tax=Arcticibacter eurypsychrophilus TaxID=1434752 RepID=UPI00084DBF14|nr:outer membrane protein transport protein [Arcticibacter eurypsychrophilus]